MRFKIILEVLNTHAIVSLNHTYLISNWLSGMVEKANQEYAPFLQERGYRVPDGENLFQFFTFSNLEIPQKDFLGDRIRIRSEEIAFILSFYLPEGLEELVMYLFHSERIYWMDRRSQAQFRVKELVPIRDEIRSEKVHLKTISPMLITQEDALGNPLLLDPDHPQFESYFWDNLICKYANCMGHYTHELLDFTQPFQPAFRLLETNNHQLPTMPKRGNLPETIDLRKMQHFEFELNAPKELIRLGLWAGFGKYNAAGYGCCALIDS